MENPIKIGIVGSRVRSTLKDIKFVFELVERLKKKYGDNLIIVSGACQQGADKFAKEACKFFNVDIVEHPVDTSTPIKNKWDYTKRAYERNSLVARDALHSLFALVLDRRKGGTEDTVTKYSEFIVAGEPRNLYLVYEDFSIEKWRPTVETLSSWNICQGNVQKLT